MTGSPTVARRELLIRLNNWRLDLKIDPPTAAKALGITPNHWHQLMSDRRAMTAELLDRIITLFDLDQTERGILLALQAQARERGWWMNYSSLYDEQVRRLFGLEDGAQSIQSYEGLVIPGLLQTEGYARAITESDIARIRPVDAEQYVEVRVRRQQRLTSEESPLQLTALIHQAALAQRIGGPEIMRGQLEHLITTAREHPDSIDIRIVPFTAETRPILSGAPFHILYFASPLLTPIVWHESVVVRGFVDDAASVRELRVLFDRQLDMALDREQSIDLIEKIAESLP